MPGKSVSLSVLISKMWVIQGQYLGSCKAWSRERTGSPFLALPLFLPQPGLRSPPRGSTESSLWACLGGEVPRSSEEGSPYYSNGHLCPSRCPSQARPLGAVGMGVQGWEGGIYLLSCCLFSFSPSPPAAASSSASS